MRKDTNIRTIGGKNNDGRDGICDEALITLLAITYACASTKTGVYIGPCTTTGSIRVKLYAGDEAVQCYIDARRGNRGILDDILEELGNDKLSEGKIINIIGRLTTRPSKAPHVAGPDAGMPEVDLPG